MQTLTGSATPVEKATALFSNNRRALFQIATLLSPTLPNIFIFHIFRDIAENIQ
jgi:hypothetical protein